MPAFNSGGGLLDRIYALMPKPDAGKPAAPTPTYPTEDEAYPQQSGLAPYMDKALNFGAGVLGLPTPEAKVPGRTAYNAGQMVQTGLPLVAPLVAGAIPNLIPWLRQRGADMVKDAATNGIKRVGVSPPIGPQLPARIPIPPRDAHVLEYAQKRYPRLMGHITDLTSIDNRIPGSDNYLAYYSNHPMNGQGSKFGEIGLKPNTEDFPNTVGHELLHAADALTDPEEQAKYTFSNSLPGGYQTNAREVRARGMGKTFATNYTNYLETLPPSHNLVSVEDGHVFDSYPTQHQAETMRGILTPGKYEIQPVPGDGNWAVVDRSHRYALHRFGSEEEANAFIGNRGSFLRAKEYKTQMKVPKSERNPAYWDKGQVNPTTSKSKYDW